VTSSYANKGAANVDDGSTSCNSDTKSLIVYNSSEISYINMVENNEDVTTEQCYNKINELNSMMNDHVNIEGTEICGPDSLGTAEQDDSMPVSSPIMNDLLSTNNSIEIPSITSTPLSVSTPNYLETSHPILNKLSNINRINFAHVNINSIQNKFDVFADRVSGFIQFNSPSSDRNFLNPFANIFIPSKLNPKAISFIPEIFHLVHPIVSYTLLGDNTNNYSSLNPSATPFNLLPLAPIPNMLLVNGGLKITRKLNTDKNIIAALLAFSITIALFLFCFIIRDVYLKFSPRVNLFKSLYIDINYDIPIIIDDVSDVFFLIKYQY
jgi:hypothetical protein